MSQPQILQDEAKRLDTLKALDLLDSEPETEFDELVHLAAAICKTPMSLITLVDDKRQWFKAAVGLAVRETPRNVAFCAHAIQRPEMFIVEDATKDPRFCENPLVTHGPLIRFYAGMPLEAPNGYRMGTICVIDTVPRKLTHEQSDALVVLANQVKVRMSLRLERRALKEALVEKERFAAGLQMNEQLFRAFMDNSPFLTYMKDERGRFVFYNKRFAERFSIEAESWLGKDCDQVFQPEIADEFRAHDNEVMQTNKASVMLEHTLENGKTSTWRSHKFPCVDPTGRRLLAGISVDITTDFEREAELRRYQAELESANRRLLDLAVTDSLTGLHNRRAFDERYAIEFSQCRRRGRPLSLVLLDIDDFKTVNDTFGHAAGDAALGDVAKLLQKTSRVPDMVARYGGEEFAVILPESDATQAKGWAERLEKALAETTWSHQPITVSMGIASLQDDVRDKNHLILRADDALYVAKRTGKRRAVTWKAPAI